MDTNCYSDLPEVFWREYVISFENSYTEDDYWAWQYLIYCNQGVDLLDDFDPNHDELTDWQDVNFTNTILDPALDEKDTQAQKDEDYKTMQNMIWKL